MAIYFSIHIQHNNFIIKHKFIESIINISLIFRALVFVEKFFDRKIPEMNLGEEELILLALVTREVKLYSSCVMKAKLRDGIRHILNISRYGNQFMQNNKPWVLVKGPPEEKYVYHFLHYFTLALIINLIFLTINLLIIQKQSCNCGWSMCKYCCFNINFDSALYACHFVSNSWTVISTCWNSSHFWWCSLAASKWTCHRESKLMNKSTVNFYNVHIKKEKIMNYSYDIGILVYWFSKKVSVYKTGQLFITTHVSVKFISSHMMTAEKNFLLKLIIFLNLFGKKRNNFNHSFDWVNIKILNIKTILKTTLLTEPTYWYRLITSMNNFS